MASEKENGDHRRSTKPIMEKRRRARINASLAELKSLLLEVMRREGSRHSKMEKADILEMTVRHLRQIQKQHFAAAVANDPSILNKYMTGFNECAAEVSRYMNTIDGVDPEVRARLLNHLANCVQGVSETSPPSLSPTVQAHSTNATVAHVRPIQAQLPPTSTSGSSSQVTIAPKPPVVPEINNNSITVTNVQLPIPNSPPQQQQQQQVSFVGGVPILPGKTQTGELAFVIPSNVLTNGQLPSYVIPVYTGSVNSSGTATQAKSPSVVPPTAAVSPCKQETAIRSPQKEEKDSQATAHCSSAASTGVQNAPVQQEVVQMAPPAQQEDDRDVWRPW